MAEKRILEAVSTMSYSKLPRLEVDPTHVLPVGLCQSSRLPDLPTDDHYTYKGSYFTFPLQCHEASKTLTPWSAAENYTHCPPSAPGHSPRTEKATCRSEMEGLKAHQRLPSSEEVGECITRERWASYVGHTGVIQQGWIQGYHPTQQLPPAPAACPTLAAPKPVYRSHVYGTESGYASKRALTFRMQMENYSKRLQWPSPSSALPTGAESCGYSPAGAKKASMAENGGVQFRQGSKEGAVHSAGFVPYRKTLEKCQGAPNGSSLDASYPSVTQKSNSESPTGSNSRKPMWSRLPPSPLPPSPAHLSSLLVNRQELAYQERSPSCYSLGSYPLTSHEQMLLYHQSYVQAEKTNSVFALAACKGFGSSASREDSQMFPGSYFQQTSRNCYPRHLESYLYHQAVVPPPLTPSEELHSTREHEHPQNATAKVDFTPKTPVSACAGLEKPTPACSPWRIRGGLPGWCESSRTAREASTNSPSLQSFPSLHQVDRLSHCYNRVEKMEENNCKKDLFPPEKVMEEQEESSETRKKLSLTYESRKRSITPHKNEPGGCIMISDSPVASHNPYSKPALPKNVPKAPNIQSASHGHWSPEGQPKGLHERREGPSTSSPPMPVINNVFSLAPYQAYLEGSTDLVELDATKTSQARESPPKSRSKSVENGFVPWTGSPRLTEESRLDLSREEGTTRDTIAKVGDGDLNKNGLPTGQVAGDYAGPWESFKVKLLNPTDPAPGQPSPANRSNGRVERLPQGDHVLDLSVKTEDLAERPDLPQMPKKAEAPDIGGPQSQGEEVKEKAADSQDSVSQANGETVVLPVNGDSRSNRHFHSSAAFLFKKFKVLKAHAAEAASGVKDVSLPKATDAQVTQPNIPLVGSSFPQTVTPSETLILQIQCLNATLPNASTTLLPPSAPPGSPALREIHALDPATEKLLGQQKYSPRQYFIVLHTCVCTMISGSVSTSSPDQLKGWLEMAEPMVELQEKTVSSIKPKNGSKVSEGPKLSKGKEIWLAFKGVEVLVQKLQSQLEIFLLYNKCPFPHVMRAGTTFIPIHVVKEELFPNLPGVSVDHVLQDHKVELRPTTLSEEKALRDLDLKSCTSRMLKLLALKQLPDIYLDLLSLHWHECVKQELEESPAKSIPNREVEALGTDTTTASLDQDFREKRSKGKPCGLAACFGTTSLHDEPLQAEDEETLPRCSSPSLQCGCVLNGVKVFPKEDTTLETKGLPLGPGARPPSHKQPRTLELKLTAKVARRTTRTSKILHLRKSVVHIQFQNALQDIQGPQLLGPSGKGKKIPPPLLLKRYKHRRHSRAKVSSLPSKYPELVGKRIRHLYEEKDKTEAWYQGVVLGVHKPHKNPLKTVYEVKYDSEPEWQYYLEILQDYKKGWVELDE